MTLLVCGGRDFTDRETLFAALDRAHAKREVGTVIVGDATGADTLALEWAESRGIKWRKFDADWTKHKKAAGPIRNQQMIDERPDGVVAFPGNKGTADTIRRAKSAGIPVWRPIGKANRAREGA